MRALVEGGVDLLLIETIFDTLNAKAAIVAAGDVLAETGADVPLWLSFTAVDRSGRNLSGQTVEAFWPRSSTRARSSSASTARSVRPPCGPWSRRSPACDDVLLVHPTPGLPNEFGGYDEGPDETSRFLGEFARDGFVNFVGGCCGTTPEHVRAIRAPSRVWHHGCARGRRRPRFSGLEPFEIGPDTGFVMIGERTNVTGSARFRRVVEAGDSQGAVEVALEQVRGGANFVDVNMDADLLESEEAMRRSSTSSRPSRRSPGCRSWSTARSWRVLEAGLRCLQGKGVVNSISLKEGEGPFLEQARPIRRFGAGVVVMAFDERGQAETVERKVEIFGRAYDLLTARGGLRAGGHHLRLERPRRRDGDRGARAVREGIHHGAAAVKERCPGSLTSGGISNLSFSFRGNDPVREAMHSAFLFHAIRPGSTWASSTPASSPSTRTSRRSCSRRSRTSYSTGGRRDRAARPVRRQVRARPPPRADLAWREEPVEERIRHALVHGIVDFSRPTPRRRAGSGARSTSSRAR